MPPHPANADAALGAAVEALAYKAGGTLNTITRLELAQKMTVRKIAAALGVSLADLGAVLRSAGRLRVVARRPRLGPVNGHKRAQIAILGSSVTSPTRGG